MGIKFTGKTKRMMAIIVAASMMVGLVACQRTNSGAVPNPAAETTVQATTEAETLQESNTGNTVVESTEATEATDNGADGQVVPTASTRPELGITVDFWYSLYQDNTTECLVSSDFVVMMGGGSDGLAKSLENRKEELSAKYRSLYADYLSEQHNKRSMAVDSESAAGQEVAVQSAVNDGYDTSAQPLEDNGGEVAAQVMAQDQGDVAVLVAAESPIDASDQGEILKVTVPYTVNMNNYVRRSDEKVVSILEEEKSSNNGEDRVAYDAVSYDVATGKVLGLEEVVSDVAAFQDAVADACEKQGLSKDAFAAALKNRTDLGKELCWTIEPQGITVWFASGELEDAVGGVHQVQLLFSENPELFVEKYAVAEGKQTTMILTDSPMVFDAGADGVRDILTVTPQYDENDDIQDVYITLGDKSYIEDEIYTYDVRPFLLITDKGTSVLYIEYQFDNDYRSLGIYDLNSGEPRMIDMMNDHFPSVFDEAKDQSIGYLFANPDSFKLATRLDLLSTVDGYRDVHVDDNGRPVFETDEYEFARDVTITTKQAIKVDLVDKDSGNVINKDVEIPGGDPLKLFRSDNETYVDAITKNDEVVRIYVDTTNDWPITVNGIDIYECFEGMIFAG